MGIKKWLKGPPKQVSIGGSVYYLYRRVADKEAGQKVVERLRREGYRARVKVVSKGWTCV